MDRQEHHLQASGRCDFDKLTTIIGRLLKAAWGNDWGTFCEAFPNGRDPNNIKLPVITYTLREMRPAMVGNKGTREIKPRIRDSFFNDSSIDGNPSAITVRGQSFEHEVVFEIWEENNAKANALAKRFRDFMMMYTGYFKDQGVKEMLFAYLNNEPENGMWRDSIVCRKVNYLIHLEEFIEIPSDVIKKVTGSIGVIDDISDNSINESRIDFKQTQRRTT